ncbi:MAG: nucleotidyltransferase domain-containing protein [Candidatus Korarchaeum sp.]
MLRLAKDCVSKMVTENSFITGVILFGSAARGEEGERSDLDLLILWEELGLDTSERYIYVYKMVSRYFPQSLGLTVIEMSYSSFLSLKKLTPLLLNVIYDGVVLYDKHGRLEEFLSKIREEIKSKGLKRKKIGKYYYWELPEAGSKVELEV